MSGPGFRPEKFADKDAVRAFLSLSKWDFSNKVKSKQPELYERLVDDVYRSGQRKRPRDQEQLHADPSGLPSLVRQQTREQFEEERLEWSTFRADFIDFHGSRGACQIRDLESDMFSTKTDLSKYTTEEGVRRMITQPRHVAYKRLETLRPEQARDFLGYGVYLATQLKTGRLKSELILNKQDLAYKAAEQKALNAQFNSAEESPIASGKERQRESSSAETPAYESSRSTPNRDRSSVVLSRNTQEPGLDAAEAPISLNPVKEYHIGSGFDSISDDTLPDLEIFDSEELRIHRLILFGLQ
ncbi:hypothetical protein I302_101800 [Kwoniella bestiolae CBS 10118]|uniref:Uncharacterized protein n=1 Tax=Kwoniella bestiolae CBS 10118 TaxID=1296100 RepID=A0A1B9GD93_9TREE|nr:hypothetical protein I302_00480 [Kwoniella bestiolae CBS 10118]OCF28989.1 hypothetical protein I302_00480 [Kwoniella bestiolae CBS 10118]